VVVLEDLVDHTNVGLIFRSAAGLGADAVLVSPQCADPLYRRSVKVSMGAVFTVPWTRAEPWPWLLDDLAAAGYCRIALTPAPDAQDLRRWRVDPGGRVALLLGSEGPGLSPAALDRVDARVRIPMKSGVDSLNVATAAALAVYTLADGR
jgi:tRNA G18 (ribose-2'-O)-methylase SpoU